MDPIRSACHELMKEFEGKNLPLTVNVPQHHGVVFVYSGENWEAFSEAIRQAVAKVQEGLLQRKKGETPDTLHVEEKPQTLADA
jgi:hypothetical protein